MAVAMILVAICAARGAPADDWVAAAVADARLALKSLDDAAAAQPAVLRLSEYPPEALRAALNVLIESTSSPDIKVRVAAYDAMGFVGPDAEAGVPVLLAVARDGRRDRWERHSAVIALGRIHRRSAEVVPFLAEGLKSDEEEDRRLALYALRFFGPEGGAAVPALLDMVRRPKDGYDRGDAARALGQIGPAAAGALSDLLPMLRSPSGYDRAGAAEGLGGVGAKDEAALRALVGALGDREEDVVAAALLALGRLGADASRAALPAVREMRATKKTELALAYARVRLRDAEAGLARLRELARAEPPVMEVFQTIGMLKGDGVPLLCEVIRARGAGTKWAVEQVGEVGPGAAAAVPVLAALLKEGRQPGPKAARFDAAVKALGAIGPAAREALPVLADLAEKHPNANVRRSAGAAVRRIAAEADHGETK